MVPCESFIYYHSQQFLTDKGASQSVKSKRALLNITRCHLWPGSHIFLFQRKQMDLFQQAVRLPDLPLSRYLWSLPISLLV